MISLRADRRDVAAGARAMAPWLAGVVPFGLVIGISTAQADVAALAALSPLPPHPISGDSPRPSPQTQLIHSRSVHRG